MLPWIRRCLVLTEDTGQPNKRADREFRSTQFGRKGSTQFRQQHRLQLHSVRQHLFTPLISLSKNGKMTNFPLELATGMTLAALQKLRKYCKHRRGTKNITGQVDNLYFLGENLGQDSVLVILFTDYLTHNGRHKTITGLLRYQQIIDVQLSVFL